MNIAEIQKKLQENKTLSNEDQKHLKSIGQSYYHITSYGITPDTNIGTEIDFNRLDVGNYFSTYSAAMDEVLYLKTQEKIRDIANKLNKENPINWADNEQSKYTIIAYWGTSLHGATIEQVSYYTIKFPGIIYCTNKRFIDEVLNIIPREQVLQYLTYTK